MKKLYSKITVALTLFLLPQISSAAPFVTCTGADCDLCNLVDMGNQILVSLIGLLFVVFAVLLAVAGFGLVTSGGNPGAKEDAKKKIVNALVGIMIVLAAWLLVDTIMKGLLKGGTGDVSGYGLWSEISCDGGQITSSLGDPATMCSGSACTTLVGSVPCKDSASCSIDPIMVGPLAAMHSVAGVSEARVTEAMPPTTNAHSNPCHYNGTCIDYSKVGGMTADEVNRVVAAANANGLRPVYEVQTPEEKEALVLGGVEESVVQVVDYATAPHFSIYTTSDTRASNGSEEVPNSDPIADGD